MRRDFLDLGLYLIHRFYHSRHPNRTRARAIGAHAELHLVGVAMDDRDVFNRQTKTIRHNLCKGCFMALTMTVAASENFDRSHRVHPHFCGLPQANTTSK